MSDSEKTSFLKEFAETLNSKTISLPSFPDVVIKIRDALEDPTCSAERLASVVRIDPVLASRLLVSANSAFHNRAGIEIVDLGLAISRLGFETVRNTAITLAVDQVFRAAQHENLKSQLRTIWDNSVAMSSMCFVIARNSESVNADNAFLCGLLHDIGRLYILSKAKSYPELLGDDKSLNEVMSQWCPSVGRSIVQAWGFSDDIAETLDSSFDDSDDHTKTVTLTDVVHCAKLVLSEGEDAINAESPNATLTRLNISDSNYATLIDAFELYVQSMRQSLSA